MLSFLHTLYDWLLPFSHYQINFDFNQVITDLSQIFNNLMQKTSLALENLTLFDSVKILIASFILSLSLFLASKIGVFLLENAIKLFGALFRIIGVLMLLSLISWLFVEWGIHEKAVILFNDLLIKMKGFL